MAGIYAGLDALQVCIAKLTFVRARREAMQLENANPHEDNIFVFICLSRIRRCLYSYFETLGRLGRKLKYVASTSLLTKAISQKL